MKLSHFYFLVRSWNSFEWFDQCIDSIFAQKNSNYTILFVDDASEYTKQQKEYMKAKLRGHVVIFNEERKFSLRNAYELIHSYAVKPNSLIINVDGDDWLIGDNVLKVLSQTYFRKPEIVLTYGNCIYYAPGTRSHLKKASDFGEINHRFPRAIEEEKNYREYFFLPLHLRSWRTEVFKKIPITQFQNSKKKWLRFCEDQAIFYPLLEKYHLQYEVITEPIYMYNQANQLNDFRIHNKEMLLEELWIRKNRRFLS